MSKLKRSKLFIDRTVQLALVRRLVFHWFCFLALSLLLATSFQFLAENPFQSFSELLTQVAQRHGIFIAVLIMLIPVFVLDTVKLSHRFAGPILRIRRAMQELAAGKEVKPVRFRKRDFWDELAQDFNKVVEQLDQAKARIAELEASPNEELVHN